MHSAKTNLSRLVDQAVNGEDVIIARSGKPVVRLVPYDPPAPKNRRVLGILNGQWTVPDDFDVPLSEQELDEFEAP